MKSYKLTKLNQTTKNNTKFEIGIPVCASGMSPQLCSAGWIHFYQHPLIAVLMNPAHAGFDPFLMWECETGGEEKHENLKSGCKVLTLTKKIEPPAVMLKSKIAFGILCVAEVYRGSTWSQWAQAWLSNEDRTQQSAAHAARAAADNSWKYIFACDARDLADIAVTRDLADIAVAAGVARGVAHVASNIAAHIATQVDRHIDFVALAEKAVTIS